VAVLGCFATVCSAAARSRANTPSISKLHAAKKSVPLTPWEQAEQGREALEAIPAENRTQADYTHAMDAYRAIYHTNPADVHAPAAVNAVAELLAEQGRTLHDDKSLRAAMGQYEFLRTQYPASSLRVQALLDEGQIAQNDLKDATKAQERYKLLLKEHPKCEQAEEARAALDSFAHGSGSSKQGTRKTAQAAVAGDNFSGAKRQATGAVAGQANPPTPSAKPSPIPGHDTTATNGTSGTPRAAKSGVSSLPATAQTAGIAATPIAPPPAKLMGVPIRDQSAMNGESARDEAQSGMPALVTGIRHWSTATYTRVAIDLGDNVTYEAARVPNPDRIYFDLHGTRLAPELVGKSFTVTDDGFLKKVRAAQYSDDVTRVVLDVNDVTEYSAFLLPNPYRLIIDIHGGTATGNSGRESASIAAMTTAPEASIPQSAVMLKPTVARPVPSSVATKSANTTSEVADLSELPGRVDATKKPTSKPISAVVETVSRNSSDATNVADVPLSGANPEPLTSSGKKTRRNKTGSDSAFLAEATPARAAVPTADGETSLVRALGLKIGRIVIDAGHGGHDSGTLGVDGIEEKDVVLDVALRLGKLLHDRLGAEIIYTRSDDTFVPLETRTAIANKAQADLFLSIHANSSPDESARGVETYYLNFTSDTTALDVAARENAVSDQSIHQLSDLVKKIALKDKIAESREFASDVECSLYAGLQRGNPGLKDRGVKKAPFVVLIGANMPSILAEISFVTNSKDAEQLRDPAYRERVAESLFKGIARYEGGLSGAHVTTERASLGQ
jgi:N-acetylmuramoyl-L-alanine amidase